MQMTPLEITAIVTAAANALSCKLTSDELTLLSVILVQLGDTLATITTVNGTQENTAKENPQCR